MIQTSEERAVIDFFATYYSHDDSIKHLWSNAGGEIGNIPKSPSAKIIWASLWRMAKAGAIASPLLIISLAFEDYPGNDALLNYLRTLVEASSIERVEAAVEKLELLPINPNSDEVVAILEQLPELSSNETFTAIAPVINGRISEKTRKVLKTILSSIGKGAAEGGKATLAAIAKGVTQAILASNGLG